jgi:transposase
MIEEVVLYGRRQVAMYLRVTSTPNSPRRAVKVVIAVRDGLKVRQKIVHHVGIGHDEKEIEKLKKIGMEYIAREKQETLKRNAQAVLEGKRGRKPRIKLEAMLPVSEVRLSDIVEERRIVEGIHEVGGAVYERLGYDRILEKKADQVLLQDLILARVALPSSKHRTRQLLDKKFGRTYDLDRIYRLLDKLHEKIGTIKKLVFEKTRSLLPEHLDMVFFDVTTLYFESVETDDLRAFGYSKDHRFNTTQLVLALATNSDGLPIGYELFSGNMAEVKTLIAALESWKQHFAIASVCFVADRAMMSKQNITMLEAHGYHYVIAAKLRTLSKALQAEILDEKRYVPARLEEELAWVGEFSWLGKRLIVSYKAGRAQRDAHQRQQAVDKIQKRIGVKGDTKKLISNQAVQKYTTTENAETVLSQDKIDKDAAWDGLHGVITNMQEKDPHTVLQHYARLWIIEESFRINKHTLAMRPIYHFKKERIEAHIALCYMAFSLLRHLQYHVNLTQKISPASIIDELLAVQSSIYVHTTTFHKYRVPGLFSNNAAKIYKSFNLSRNSHAHPYLN